MKALWALDPFHQNSDAIQSMHSLVSSLTQSPDDIELGYVATQKPPGSSPHPLPHYPVRVDDYSKKLIQRQLQEAHIELNPTHLHVVNNQTLSMTAIVDSLLRLARQQNADVVALYTQTRKGLVDKLIGSFAETAMHRSRMDLLLMNPKTEFSGHIKNVTFAYDFEKTSKKHFLKALQYCHDWSAQLTVVHASEIVYRWSLDEKNPRIQKYRERINQKKIWIEDEAQKKGVPLQIVIESDFDSISEAILKEAQQAKADLLILGAKSGPHMPLMGGSVARQVVRTSGIPILILRS